MSVTIEVDGLSELGRYMDLAPRIAKTAARVAINQTAERKGLVALRDLMSEEVAFPENYLRDPKRLAVTQRARDGNLEARVTARSRPTSLARFASGASIIGRRAGGGGLTVRVNPSLRRTLSQAFLVRLRAGEGPVTDDSFNIGLAIRLKAGEVISNKIKMAPFGGGLYLLYGPSVDQVYRTVAASNAPMIADYLAEEFFRQFVLRSEGKV